MFGYLNTGNPRLIGDAEAQEIKNAAIDEGYLTYKEYETNALNNLQLTLPNGKIVEVDLDGVLGQVMWKDSSTGTLKQIGLDAPNVIVIDDNPWTTTSRIPTVANAAYASNPYAAGNYTYAVTLYDPDTEEESIPATWDVVVYDHATAPGGEIIQFTNFPSVADLFPGRTNLQWRIYRMPAGGSEFLLVNGATTISANSAYAGPYQDIIADEDLGTFCDSLDDGVSYLRTKYAAGVELFNDHLFVFGSIGETAKINFSRQGKWWAFPPENELNFPGRFKGACVINESLVLLGSEGAYVLYGDNVDNFSLKKIDLDLTGNDGIGVTLRSARSLAGLAIFGLSKSITFEGDAGTGLVQITAFDGARAKSLSEKIKSLFPLADNSSIEAMETSIVDNRFYAIRTIDLDATLAVVEAAGRTWAGVTSADYVYITLIFDSYTAGWMTADDTSTFTYRTKEFFVPRNVQFHKRIWIEAEGTFTLQFLGDGEVVTELSLIHSGKQKQYYNIKPYRYDTFSFRFIGNADCKIYEYGVDE